MRRALASAIAGAAVVLALSGCSSPPSVRVLSKDVGHAQPATGTIGALERGTVRREAVAYVRKAVDAWMAGDLETMRRYFPKRDCDEFAKAWASYEGKDAEIVHVHAKPFLDAVEMSKDGSEVAIDYQYDDESYLKVASGRQALPKVVASWRIYVKRDGASWRITDVLSAARQYR